VIVPGCLLGCMGNRLASCLCRGESFSILFSNDGALKPTSLTDKPTHRPNDRYLTYIKLTYGMY
jgi:hypothetical protein